jgi:hypothetical protein
MEGKWESFSQEDPFNPGNVVTGSICKSESKLYGALVIQEVNGKSVEPKLIYCTPKIHYPFDRDRNYRFPECVKVEAYEKWDGTNILKFNYQDSEGKKFISFKTRLMPFIQKHRPFYDMWNHILGSYPSWYGMMKEIDHALSFELVGSGNPHLIKYNFLLDAHLLFGVSPDGEIIPPNKVKYYEVFNKSPLLVTFDDKSKLVEYYAEQRESMEKRINKIEGTEMYDGSEGQVWYMIKPNGYAQMFKLKSETVESIHMAASNKPTRNSIIATAYNVLEEYPEVTWDNLFVLLKEEWDEIIINKYKALIDSCINFVNNVTRIRNEAKPILEKLFIDNGWTMEENKNNIMRHMAGIFGNKNTTLVYNVITNKI